MELFKFRNPMNPTLMEQGEIINGITDLMWIERYRDAGEFTIKAPVSSGIRTKLPIGTFISHTDSTDIMIVENHEINSNNDEVIYVVITGRSFETFLENRIAGINHVMPSAITDYVLPAAFTKNQAIKLIQDHISTPYNGNDTLQNVDVGYKSTSNESVAEARVIKRVPVYSALMEILDVDTLGIKTIRPWTAESFGTPGNTILFIYSGTDRSSSIVYSYDSGDITNADYLWSNKNTKTSMLVTGRWVEVLVNKTGVGYNRRIEVVDGSFIDNSYTAMPAGAAYTQVVNSMTTFGNQILAGKKDVAIVKAEVYRNLRRYIYRKDYDLGDIVTVRGEYDSVRKMRIIEHVEIEDKNGESSYPTLSVL